MAKQTRNFVSGRMNKSVDERLLPKGEYIDAMNIRVGSTELTDVGAVENSKGNSPVTALSYNGADLSDQATCIGTFADSEQETIYWFVHDPAHTTAINGKVDMVVSYDTTAQQLTYHVVTELLLNFNPQYLINSVDKIDDLFFFTDNYNEPRKINVTRDYPFPDVTALPADVDQIIELDISVIKPPPLEAPTIEFAQIAGGENYIEDTFICFAYRYQYADGEYSALSQFTAPAFAPDSRFVLGIDSLLNEGMQNKWNQVDVTYNTGIEQVKGVDLVFKEADSNNIFVIDEYDVETLTGQTNTVSFTNGEIYTVLRSDEILRLYDNVPLKANAQNIFGNRLLYGNYVEQRDLTDSTGQAIDLSYTVTSQSSNTTGATSLPSTLSTRGINVDSSLSAPQNIPFGKVAFDLSGIDTEQLVEGAVFQFVLNCQGESFSYNGYRPPVASIADSFNLSASFQVVLSFKLNTSYVSSGLAGVFSVWGNSHFATVSGWNAYQGSPTGDPSWVTGNTWYDIFNAAVPSVNATQIAPFTVDTCMATQYQGNVTPNDQAPNLNNTSPDPNNTLGQLGAQNDWGGLIIELSGNNLIITPPAHRYRRDDVTYCSGGVSRLFQYFRINTASGYFSTQRGLKSLHSNRDYQVGIIYQDSNARQTTVLVSENNSQHIPARNSTNLNHLRVTIPVGMRPPSWAERYKFMLKPSQGLYDTVYSDTMFTDIETGSVWVLLEGEQTNKVVEGLRLIVKSDSNGPLNNAAYATVLEVVNQSDNFLDRADIIVGGIVEQPAGVYMKVVPVGWSGDSVNYNVFDSGNLHGAIEANDGGSQYNQETPSMMIPVCLNAGSQSDWDIQPLAITAGDNVRMRFHFNRNHANEDGEPCGGVSSLYERTYTATQDYPDFKAFWDGDGVSVANDTDTYVEVPDSQSPSTQSYIASNPILHRQYDIPWLFSFNNPTPLTALEFGKISGLNQYQFRRLTIDNTTDPTTGFNTSYTGDDFLVLCLKGGITACVGEAQYRDSAIFAQITVRGGDGELIFETVPNKVADGIYYEGADNYPITDGFHMANPAEIDGDVDQTATTQAIVNLSFFNCFAFGNGAESYRILDSLTGNYFTLGNRSAGVTTQDYEQIRREASITYSGVYQEQTALNNLNNFNLGLANYKDCEESYGPIEILHSFRDNLLVLQEDKISYIQVNKSLISGADGSNLVTAVPTILGTQIARIEEYGISNNPESFATYGRDMFFTDAKRSSVIKLSGSVGQGDALQVISSIGMRSWFRDLFQESFTTQKLGGYDPYMDEYVLSSNTISLPLQIPRIGCSSRGGAVLPPIQWLGLTGQTQYIVSGGNGVGTMQFTFTQTEDTEYTITYNGVDTGPTLGAAGVNLIMTVSKDVASISDLLVTVDPQDVDLSSITTMFPACPTGSEIKVVMVCLTDAQDANQTVINQHNYAVSTFTSPIIPTTVTFNSGFTSPIVSQFNETTGISGTAGFPSSSSTVTMGAVRTGATSNDFQFNTALNEFAFVLGSTNYDNTPADIALMLNASTPVVIDGTQAPDLYTGDFPVSGTWDRLYLIYDYRRAGSAMFCHSTSIDPTDSDEVCCDCTANLGCTPFLGTNPVSATSSLACAIASASYTYYHNGNSVAPSIGDTIYSAPDCTSGVFLGADNYIRLGDGSNEYIQVNSSGTIIAKTSC